MKASADSQVGPDEAAPVVPNEAAIANRAVGVHTPSLRKTADTWLSTVRPDKTSRVAISVLCSPDASSRSTSVSGGGSDARR
jgi:hypothetical protein